MRSFRPLFTSSTLIIFILSACVLITSCAFQAYADVSLEHSLTGQAPTVATFSATDTLGSYYGTIRMEMKDGSYVTPFGTDVIIESFGSGNVVQKASTNNKGRFYLNNLENGRYIFKIQHNKKTVYTDTLTITSSTAQNLGTRVVDIQRIQ